MSTLSWMYQLQIKGRQLLQGLKVFFWGDLNWTDFHYNLHLMVKPWLQVNTAFRGVVLLSYREMK